MTLMNIGKRGITPEFIDTLRTTFKKREIVKISLLKSFSRDREEIKKTAEKIAGSLKDEKFNYVHRIIGFTIVMLKRKKHKK
jgi:RNA-binding protein YhbY